MSASPHHFPRRAIPAPPLQSASPRVRIPQDPEEVRPRVESARQWAARYSELGWPVAPSCDGSHVECVAPDRHPRDVHWVQEVTTDPLALDQLWKRRRAYGIVGKTGEHITALYFHGAEWSGLLAAFSRARLDVPLARLAAQEEMGPAKVYAVVHCTREAVTGPNTVTDHIVLHPAELPLPLPAADSGGHVTWLSAPGRPLPTLAAVVEAAAPLYEI